MDLATLAGVTGVSIHHFARGFKQSAGVTPHRHARTVPVGATLEWVETSPPDGALDHCNPLIAISMLRHDLSASRSGSGSVAENSDREGRGHCIYKTPLGDACALSHGLGFLRLAST
jgi:hypothetical protein